MRFSPPAFRRKKLGEDWNFSDRTYLRSWNVLEAASLVLSVGLLTRKGCVSLQNRVRESVLQSRAAKSIGVRHERELVSRSHPAREKAQC